MSDKVWFTSDEHYGHSNIIKFCNRPFKDIYEQTEEIVKRHNEVVKAGDRVYHLGDMFWRTLTLRDVLAIRYRLNGQHYYIYGNHDELFHSNQVLRDSFIWCKDTFNFKADGLPNIWLSHYAHEDWNGSHRGAYHLFGHVHGQKPEPVGLKLDVGVDCWNYYPVSLDVIAERLGKKAEATVHKFWSCNNVDCKSKFNAVDTAPKICAKCGSTMKLMSRFEEARP
jgi:calcineurin-like phosphoesterase family protein